MLQGYAAGFAAPDHWFFLTGPEAELRRIAVQGFKLPLEDAPEGAAGEPILHSTRFVLVDAHGRIRGYYDAFDEEAMARLVKDFKAVARGR